MNTATFFLWLERCLHLLLSLVLVMMLFLIAPDFAREIGRRTAPDPPRPVGLEIEPALDAAEPMREARRLVLRGFQAVPGHSVLRASLVDEPRGRYEKLSDPVNVLFFDPATRTERWLIEGDPTASPWILASRDLRRVGDGDEPRRPERPSGATVATLWHLRPRPGVAAQGTPSSIALAQPDGSGFQTVLQPVDLLHDAHVIGDDVVVTWSGAGEAQWALLDLETGAVLDRGAVGASRGR